MKISCIQLTHPPKISQPLYVSVSTEVWEIIPSGNFLHMKKHHKSVDHGGASRDPPERAGPWKASTSVHSGRSAFLSLWARAVPVIKLNRNAGRSTCHGHTRKLSSNPMAIVSILINVLLFTSVLIFKDSFTLGILQLLWKQHRPYSRQCAAAADF